MSQKLEDLVSIDPRKGLSALDVLWSEVLRCMNETFESTTTV